MRPDGSLAYLTKAQVPEQAPPSITAEALQDILRESSEASRQQIAALHENLSTSMTDALQQVSRASNANTVQVRHCNHPGIGYNAKIAGIYASLDGNLISCGIECVLISGIP